MTLQLLAQPISASAFAPFGSLLAVNLNQTGRSANQGSATRRDFAAELVNTRPHAKLNQAVFRCQPRVMPFGIGLLERHPYSTQTFVPMSGNRYIVVVAPGGDEGPDLSALQAFVCSGPQSVQYRLGVWHHPMIALDAASDFVMLAYEDGTKGDCEEWHLPQPIQLSL